MHCLRTFTVFPCTNSKTDFPKKWVSNNFSSHHFCLFVTSEKISIILQKDSVIQYLLITIETRNTKFQRKQLKGTSESNFTPFFVALLLTANLPNRRLHVLDPKDHNHIHCRFPNRKCALYISCCCPDWKRERHYFMAINNNSA